MQKVTSTIIGDLIQDERFKDWWNANDIPIPFFDNSKLGITIMGFTFAQDEHFLQQADEALSNFLQKGPEDRLEISSYVFENFEEFKYAVGESDVSEGLQELEEEQKIWDFVKPNGITIERRHRRDQDIYISISLHCEW